jgi:hypothetical protein
MAFISNKERAKVSSKLYRGAGFRKFFILVSLICGVLCTLMVLLGLLVALGKVDSYNFSLIHTVNGKLQLTTYGIVVTVVAGIALVGGIISFILLLTMRSPKSITKDVYKLTSSALPGKKTTKHTASEARERL